MTAITERLGNTGSSGLTFACFVHLLGVCGSWPGRLREDSVESFQSGSILLSGIEAHRALVTWVIPYGFILLGLQFLRMGVNAVSTRRYREVAEEAGI